MSEILKSNQTSTNKSKVSFQKILQNPTESTKSRGKLLENDMEIIKNKIKSHRSIIEITKSHSRIRLEEIKSIKNEIKSKIQEKKEIKEEIIQLYNRIKESNEEKIRIKERIIDLSNDISSLKKLKEEKELFLINLISKREYYEEIMLTYISRGKDKDFTLYENSYMIDMSTHRSIDNLNMSNYKKIDDENKIKNKKYILEMDSKRQNIYIKDLLSHLSEWDSIYDFTSCLSLFTNWIESAMNTNKEFLVFPEKVGKLVNKSELSIFIYEFIVKYTNWYIISKQVDEDLNFINKVYFNDLTKKQEQVNQNNNQIEVLSSEKSKMKLKIKEKEENINIINPEIDELINKMNEISKKIKNNENGYKENSIYESVIKESTDEIGKLVKLSNQIISDTSKNNDNNTKDNDNIQNIEKSKQFEIEFSKINSIGNTMIPSYVASTKNIEKIENNEKNRTNNKNNISKNINNEISSNNHLINKENYLKPIKISNSNSQSSCLVEGSIKENEEKKIINISQKIEELLKRDKLTKKSLNFNISNQSIVDIKDVDKRERSDNYNKNLKNKEKVEDDLKNTGQDMRSTLYKTKTIKNEVISDDHNQIGSIRYNKSSFYKNNNDDKKYNDKDNTDSRFLTNKPIIDSAFENKKSYSISKAFNTSVLDIQSPINNSKKKKDASISNILNLNEHDDNFRNTSQKEDKHKRIQSNQVNSYSIYENNNENYSQEKNCNSYNQPLLSSKYNRNIDINQIENSKKVDFNEETNIDIKIDIDNNNYNKNKANKTNNNTTDSYNRNTFTSPKLNRVSNKSIEERNIIYSPIIEYDEVPFIHKETVDLKILKNPIIDIPVYYNQIKSNESMRKIKKGCNCYFKLINTNTILDPFTLQKQISIFSEVKNKNFYNIANDILILNGYSRCQIGFDENKYSIKFFQKFKNKFLFIDMKMIEKTVITKDTQNRISIHKLDMRLRKEGDDLVSFYKINSIDVINYFESKEIINEYDFDIGGILLKNPGYIEDVLSLKYFNFFLICRINGRIDENIIYELVFTTFDDFKIWLNAMGIIGNLNKEYYNL